MTAEPGIRSVIEGGKDVAGREGVLGWVGHGWRKQRGGVGVRVGWLSLEGMQSRAYVDLGETKGNER